MANFNLTNQQIKDTYEQLAQIGTSSLLLDGTGSIVTSLEITASQATSASYAANVGSPSWDSVTDKPSGLVSSSAQTLANVKGQTIEPTEISGAFGTIKSRLDFFEIKPELGSSLNGVRIGDEDLSNYVDIINTGTTFYGQDVSVENDLQATNISVTGQFIGDLVGSASYAPTILPDGVVSSSTQTIANISGQSISPSDVVMSGTLIATTASIGNIDATKVTVSSDLIVNGTASFAYLESITGSAKIIGDAYIVLNNNTPTERYAGIVVQDSGSTNNTASLEFDGQTNDWFYEYTDDGGATQEFGAVMFGPGYNTRGSHVYPSNNTILKGTGDHHIVDSIITDDGSTVTVAGIMSASSYEGDGSSLANLPLNGLVSGIAPDSIQSDALLTSTPATASNTSSIALGNNAKAGGRYGIAIGDGAGLSGGQDTIIAIGSNAHPGDSYGIGIGGDARGGYQGVGIGYNANASGYGIAIGASAQTTNNNAVAIGANAVATSSANEISINNVFKYDGTSVFTLEGSVNATSFTGSIAASNVDGTVSNADTASMSSGNFEVQGQLYSPTFAGTIASSTSSIDFDNGNFATLNCASSTFLANPTNLQGGTTYTLIITNGANISGYGTAWKFAGGTEPTLSANTDVITAVSDGTSLYAAALADFS